MTYKFYLENSIDQPFLSKESNELTDLSIDEISVHIKNTEFTHEGSQYKILDTNGYGTPPNSINEGFFVFCEEIS